VQVLHAQRQGALINVRMTHGQRPCEEAQPADATLEEALMAQRYALPQGAPPGLAA
jgi:ABC-2 type transport system ATP-binding protein